MVDDGQVAYTMFYKSIYERLVDDGYSSDDIISILPCAYAYSYAMSHNGNVLMPILALGLYITEMGKALRDEIYDTFGAIFISKCMLLKDSANVVLEQFNKANGISYPPNGATMGVDFIKLSGKMLDIKDVSHLYTLVEDNRIMEYLKALSEKCNDTKMTKENLFDVGYSGNMIGDSRSFFAHTPVIIAPGRKLIVSFDLMSSEWMRIARVDDLFNECRDCDAKVDEKLKDILKI